MPQAMLIDINTAAITHRNGTLSGITDRNYAKVIRHLYCYNAALPKEYKVTVDTEEYNEKIKLNMVAICGFCKEEIDQSQVKTFPLRVSSLDRLTNGFQKTETVWTCPKCDKDNRQKDTKFIKSVLKKPYYLRCVPEAPSRTTGIVDRTTYDAKFEKWASDFLEELEEAAAKFRQEYKPKDPTEFDESNIDLSVEKDD